MRKVYLLSIIFVLSTTQGLAQLASHPQVKLALSHIKEIEPETLPGKQFAVALMCNLEGAGLLNLARSIADTVLLSQ